MATERGVLPYATATDLAPSSWLAYSGSVLTLSRSLTYSGLGPKFCPKFSPSICLAAKLGNHQNLKTRTKVRRTIVQAMASAPQSPLSAGFGTRLIRGTRWIQDRRIRDLCSMQPSERGAGEARSTLLCPAHSCLNRQRIRRCSWRAC
jgi:hypothetical protein